MSTIPEIDFAGVSAARARLIELVNEHPELTGPRGVDNRAGWEAVLRENENMSPITKTTGFRLPEALLARVDAYAEHLTQYAGVPVSRAAAVVKLLSIALERVEAEASPTKRKR